MYCLVNLKILTNVTWAAWPGPLERNMLSRLECWSLVGGGALRYLKEFCLDRHLSTSLKYIVIKFFLKEPIDEPSLYVFLKFFFKKVSV